MRKILIPLAFGFEEIEAITCIDVLRRTELEVITVSIDKMEVLGAHNIVVKSDALIDDINWTDFDAIVLPGGMPGSANLRDNEKVISIVKQLYSENKLVAAICAAPIVLEKAGVIVNKNATSYPGFDKEMTSCNYMENRVVVDGNVITARGPGVAIEFSLTVVEYLLGKGIVEELKVGMLVK